MANTKRVRMLVNMAGPAQSFDPGVVYEFDIEEAERLIKAGFAEPAEAEIETAVFKPPENAAKRIAKNKKGD